MRIITGRYKGFHLKMPPTNGVRPTTDRVKESIFNIIMNLKSFNEACVLDLYAGSGSLGFESLSRGAARVVFVDKSPVCIRTL
jgi:16S rRNA (guanine966-N2)-methyltransferase